MLGLVIEDALEQLVVMPLQSRLLEGCLETCRGDQHALSQRQEWLRGGSQEAFGVPSLCRSRTRWGRAVGLLEFFAEAEGHTPTARLALLLRVKAEVTPIRAISMPFQRWFAPIPCHFNADSRHFNADSCHFNADSCHFNADSCHFNADLSGGERVPHRPSRTRDRPHHQAPSRRRNPPHIRLPRRFRGDSKPPGGRWLPRGGVLAEFRSVLTVL
jgi:hypothetical protein